MNLKKVIRSIRQLTSQLNMKNVVNKYDFVNGLETHPNISIAFDKNAKKKIIVKKCFTTDEFENELNATYKFKECKFIEKIIEYDIHQNIVIYNYNEYKDLADYMRQYPLTLEQSTYVVLSPILQALEFIHEKGYAHRNIKPGSILYYDNGCKLIDFKFCESNCGHYTDRNGTLHYMAPEETYKEGCLESDIWSLGIVYYECIHKRLPYYSHPNDKSNFYQLFKQIRTRDIMTNIELDLSILGIFKLMLSRDTNVRKNCYQKLYALIKNIHWNTT